MKVDRSKLLRRLDQSQLQEPMSLCVGKAA